MIYGNIFSDLNNNYSVETLVTALKLSTSQLSYNKNKLNKLIEDIKKCFNTLILQFTERDIS